MKVDFNQRKGVHANLTKVGKREREGSTLTKKFVDVNCEWSLRGKREFIFTLYV